MREGISSYMPARLTLQQHTGLRNRPCIGWSGQGLLCVLLMAVSVSVFAAGQNSPPETGTDAVAGTTSTGEVDATAAAEPAAEQDLCDWHLEGQELQEQTQELVYGVSCHSFRWLDQLFGAEKDFPEDQVNGIWLLGFDYRQYDQFDYRGRFRVRATLPNLSGRWNVIVGRENQDEFLSDTAPGEQTLFNPGLSRDEDNEWLLGLG
ncbi:MAG TPA: hypothetical protein VJN01_11835, partial [Xanthomonadales bacterium]|nr:hypothetical protein [Xanthomonadales bacterium]